MQSICLLQLQQKSDETETTTTSAQSSETPPPVTAAASTALSQRQQQQQHRQRAGVRDERRQWLVLQDRKSRSFDSSFEDRRQQPAPPRRPAGDQYLHPPHSTGVEDNMEDEYRSRRRRLHETQRKSRSLDVYEPNPNTEPNRSAFVVRQRKSPARMTDELTERTHRIGRCFDSFSTGQEQRYATNLFLPCVCDCVGINIRHTV